MRGYLFRVTDRAARGFKNEKLHGRKDIRFWNQGTELSKKAMSSFPMRPIMIVVLFVISINFLALSTTRKEDRFAPEAQADKRAAQALSPRLDDKNVSKGASLRTLVAQSKQASVLAMQLTPATAAAPSNDNFSNAQVITGILSTVTGTNNGATKELGEPNHAGNSGGASVWYRWQPPSNGAATFATFGSNFDTLLAVYTGSSVGNLTPIADNDDADNSTLQSALSFDAQAGVVYYIAVDGFAGATGSIVLGWSLSSPIFNSRFVVQVGSDARFNMGAFPDASGGGGPNSWDLMYRWPNTPGTSFSTLRVDGVDNVYGSSGLQIEGPHDVDGATNRSKWRIGDIEITQTLEIVFNPQTNQNDVAKISYEARNTGSVSHQTGLRVMIDSEVNYNDGVPFRVPGIGIVTTETEFTGPSVPNTFQGFFDVTDSSHVAVSTLKSGGATAPDRLVLASWPQIHNTAYDYAITPNLDFTADSAYALYWNPASLAPGASRTYVTFYGLSQLDVNLQPPLALGVTGPASLSVVNGQYSPNPFDVVATVFNNGNATATNVRLTLNLPAGLSLAAGSATQSLGDLAVGQEKQASWKVTAAPQSSQITLTYSVDATASNAQTKTVQRQISLAAIQKTPLIFIPGIAGSIFENSQRAQVWPPPSAFEFALNPLSSVYYKKLSLATIFFDANVTVPDIIRTYEQAAKPEEKTVYEKFLNALAPQANGLYREYDAKGHPERLTYNGCDDQAQKQNNPSLFVFAYDWRKSNLDAAVALEDYVRCIQKFYPNTDVDIVAHSQGGLVARRYILRNPGQHHVRKMITVGSPWLGAPKAINVLETGYFTDASNVVKQGISNSIFKELSEFYPAVHELIPSQSYFDLLGQPPYPYKNNEQYLDYGQTTTLLDQQFQISKPGLTNRAFHGRAGQDDWRSDTSGVEYHHLYGILNTPTTVGTVVQQVVRVGFDRYTRFDVLPVPGDGTVPVVSARRILGGTSYNAPNVTIQSGRLKAFFCGSGCDNEHPVDHTGLMRNPDVINEVLNILTAPFQPQTAPDSEATRRNQDRQSDEPEVAPAYFLKVIGVASATIQDSSGNTASPLADPPLNTIPSVASYRTGDKSFLTILPVGFTYSITLRTGTGSLAIELTQGTDTTTTQAIRYQDLSLPAGVNARIQISPQGIDALRYDADGDGTFETTVNPTVSLTGTAAQDTESPAITIGSTNQQGGNLLITIAATDTGSGIKDVFYSLNGQNYSAYAGPFPVNPYSGVVISAYADDNSANRSGLVTYYPSSTVNQIDNAQFFVRQHYIDFLNRDPDSSGLAYWTSQITQCAATQACINNKRIDVSNAFFYELEYQQTGSYVYRLYRAAYGNNQPFSNPDNSNPVEAHKLPSYAVFAPDRTQVVGGSSLAQSQLDFANAFVQRAEFLTKYPASLDGPSFVDAVLATIRNDIGVNLSSQRQALIDLFNAGGRGAVLYRLADDNVQTNPISNRAFVDAEYNRAFVATQYFGYLRRDSDIGGFFFWLGQVNSGPLRDTGKQHAMVCSFITSDEYQQRFSPVVTHHNAECPQ